MTFRFPSLVATVLLAMTACDRPSPTVSPATAPIVNMRFSDSNGDGMIDVMQIDHTTHHVTAWIDDDFDGRFDRRIYEIEGEVQSEAEVDIQVPQAPGT